MPLVYVTVCRLPFARELDRERGPRRSVQGAPIQRPACGGEEADQEGQGRGESGS